MAFFEGCSVGDLDPVEVATQNFFRVATQKKYPIANQTRSRPELGDRVEIFWVATRISVPTRSKILDCFHQAVCPGKFFEKYSGRDPKKPDRTGRDRTFSGSRPITGRDRYFFWVATGF
jgi:hypothetical protein